MPMLAPFLIFSLASFVSLLIHVPFLGALVRLRANYTPKGLQIGEEGGMAPPAGLGLPDYFAMLLRIKRIEGWPGLWKGFMPSLIVSNLILLLVIIWMETTPIRNMRDQSTLGIAIYVAFRTVLTVPMTVILNRAITTPHNLPWFAPLRSLRILLTPTEFSKPWRIYLAPGLIPVCVIHALWLVVAHRTVRSQIFPRRIVRGSIRGGHTGEKSLYNPFENFSIDGFIAYIIFVVGYSIAVITPLEVLTTRLAVQHNHEPGFSTVPQEQEEKPDIEYTGRDEDVIALRPEDNPYKGLKHCWLSILEEEGPLAFYRGWWVTVIVGVLTAFS